MARHFIAIIHKESDCDFGVCFPDLPGCFSACCSLDEAGDMAAEALAAWIEDAAASGEAIPEPSSLETIAALPDSADAQALLVVPAPRAKPGALGVTLCVDLDDLAAIDAAADKKGMGREEFMVWAVKKEAIGEG